MVESKLIGVVREVTGKVELKNQRKNGFIPANLYGPEIEKNITFFLNEKELNKAVKSGKKVHSLEFEGTEHMVILREVQRHPVTWALVHADIVGLTPGVETKLSIPLRFEGIPEGVRNQGGVLIVNSRYLQIEALPKNVPDEIVIDVTELALTHNVHASDIERENVTVVSPGSMLLCSVNLTRAAVAAGEDEEGAEGEEGEEGEEGAEAKEDGKE
ncbi:MAG: 50S ribosomal protein L25 [Candidatus Delongbacteria bacterium]|jgi:large subunit ribosomal protein L25|nr:50S ribosomal protein L25 [Candidatus Delongbacteria bacterium]